MPYRSPVKLTERVGNNCFAYEKRMQSSNLPSLTIPMRIYGTLDDVSIGEDIVFAEEEDGVLRECRGLTYFVTIPRSDGIPPITIVDNHQHALYFWLEAIQEGYVESGFELIHIDEHSDLWDNEHTLDHDRALEDLEYAWHFTNYECNVGNYIQGAIRSGLISRMIRIENQADIDTYMSHAPTTNSILNLDLDFFAPEMDFIPEEAKLTCIRQLIPQVAYITIATSPFFIDQTRAIQKLRDIFSQL